MHNFSIYKISPTVLHTVMLYVNRLRFCACPLLTKNAFVVGKVLRHLAHKSMHAKQLCVYACYCVCMCVAAVYQPIQLSTRQPVCGSSSSPSSSSERGSLSSRQVHTIVTFLLLFMPAQVDCFGSQKVLCMYTKRNSCTHPFVVLFYPPPPVLYPDPALSRG